MTFQRYMDIIHESNDCSFFPGEKMDREQYLDSCAGHMYELCTESSRMLWDQLFPILDDIENQSREQIDELVTFANDLLSFNKHWDIALSLGVHQAVLRYARAHQDFDLTMQQLYRCGMAQYYVQTNFAAA